MLRFQLAVVELRRAVRASNRVLADLQRRVDHVRVAARRATTASTELLATIEQLDRDLLALRTALSGDASLTGREKPAPMSITERIENVAGAQLYTTSAPTRTERDAYEHAADAFEPVLARLRAIATEELPAVERALEAAGAADTPGRLPDWRRR